MKAAFFIDCALGNSGVTNTSTDSSGLPVTIRFKDEKNDTGDMIGLKAILECTKGAKMEGENIVTSFRKRIGACTWGKEKSPIEIVVIENGIEGDKPTTNNCITWSELLVLLQQFTQSLLVREVKLWKNEAAALSGMTPDHHVDIDLIVYYYNEEPTSESQEAIAKGFIGDNGVRKIWDGLNVASLWEDKTVRMYNCRLYFPPSVSTKVSMFDDLTKIGFKPNESGTMLGSARYIFSKEIA